MNVIINKELVKDICDILGQFICLYCIAGTRIIKTEATLLAFGIVWFDNMCIVNIIFLSKAKNKHRVIYNSAEGNQFIMIMSDKELIFEERPNRLFYYDLEDHDLVLVNTVDETQEVLSHRELSGDREARYELAMFGYLSIIHTD